VFRIEKKLPPEAAHLVLYTKQGKGYIALDDDRTLASYKFDEKSKVYKFYF
jgi:hypothetical protein